MPIPRPGLLAQFESIFFRFNDFREPERCFSQLWGEPGPRISFWMNCDAILDAPEPSLLEMTLAASSATVLLAFARISPPSPASTELLLQALLFTFSLDFTSVSAFFFFAFFLFLLSDFLPLPSREASLLFSNDNLLPFPMIQKRPLNVLKTIFSSNASCK